MKKEVIAIVAYLKGSRGIGYQGKLPWKSIPTDIERFKKFTLGNIVIMGRKTWESIPKKYRPFSDRVNIIVSNTLTLDDVPAGVLVFKDLKEALNYAQEIDNSWGQKIFIGGGGDIYNKAMEENLLNTILATVVHDNSLEFDTQFPEITHNWKTIYEGREGIDESSQITIQFLTMKNRKNPFPLGN